MKPTPGRRSAPRRRGARSPLPSWRSSAGIVALAIGVFGGAPTAIGVGVVLAGLGGIEVAIREHLAGFRSHTTLLAGFVFVAVVALLFYAAGQLLAVALAIGAVAFVVAFIGLRRVFQRASGGLSFRRPRGRR